MLELQLDEATHVFIAPCQMKANNGILIIDDFGRQMVSPRELLNRWIVPLDRRVDYLTLASGMKFQVPFELMVVFSTNLNPHDLADEAFLRRIQTKVLVDNVSAEVFDRDLPARDARPTRCPAKPGCAEYLRQRCARGRREVPARLLPDRYLPAGESHQRIRRPAGPHDARQYRPRRGALLRQEPHGRGRVTAAQAVPVQLLPQMLVVERSGDLVAFLRLGEIGVGHEPVVQAVKYHDLRIDT